MRRIDDAMMMRSQLERHKETNRPREKTSKHVEKLLQQEEQMATQDIEIEDSGKKCKADVEHKTMRKLRNEITRRSKFVEMEKAEKAQQVSAKT